MPYTTVPEGYAFIEGRSQAVTSSLLESAEAAGATPYDVQPYTLKGYLVPQAVADEYENDGVKPTITFPQEGDVVAQLAGIRGVAEPGAEVELWMETSPGAAVATTTASASGDFSFSGDTPLTPGPETITVKVGDVESDPVTITVNDDGLEDEA